MMSIPILLKNTPRDVLFRANKCGILGFFASRGIDQVLKTYVLAVCGVVCRPPHGSGKLHRVELRLYKPPDKRSSLFGKNGALWCTCSCEYFTYNLEVALSLKGSSSLLNSNGKLPNIKNPRYIPYVCKHIAAAIYVAQTKSNVNRLRKKL